MKNWDNDVHERALERRAIKRLAAIKADIESGKYDTYTVPSPTQQEIDEEADEVFSKLTVYSNSNAASAPNEAEGVNNVKN